MDHGEVGGCGVYAHRHPKFMKKLQDAEGLQGKYCDVRFTRRMSGVPPWPDAMKTPTSPVSFLSQALKLFLFMFMVKKLNYKLLSVYSSKEIIFSRLFFFLL